MAFTCDSCRRRTSGTPTVTVTGRELCGACDDQLTGAAMGLVGGRGIGEAISITGRYARLRTPRRARAGAE